METHAETATINGHLYELESLTMRLAACWDGELMHADPQPGHPAVSILDQAAVDGEVPCRITQ